MTKGSSLILRLYFAVVAAVTLFTLMYGLIDFLSIGLKTYIFTAADVPTYLESCENPGTRYPEAKPVSDTGNSEYTDEELQAMCERRNADAIANYERQKADQAVRNLALVLVSLPLFITHFRVVYRDWKEIRKA